MARRTKIDQLTEGASYEILQHLLAAHPELMAEALTLALDPKPPAYYEVEVDLQEAEPRAWRRFLITARATFLDLHEAIQAACGWENSHLFSFNNPRTRVEIAGVLDASYGSDPSPDAAGITLASFMNGAEQAACTYQYDFGDCWDHDISLRVVRLPEKFTRRLVAGEMAFPPEDCGGMPGYLRCAIAARTGEDPEPDPGVDLFRWLGAWHPDFFDLGLAAKAFDRPRGRKRPATRHA